MTTLVNESLISADACGVTLPFCNTLSSTCPPIKATRLCLLYMPARSDMSRGKILCGCMTSVLPNEEGTSIWLESQRFGDLKPPDDGTLLKCRRKVCWGQILDRVLYLTFPRSTKPSPILPNTSQDSAIGIAHARAQRLDTTTIVCADLGNIDDCPHAWSKCISHAFA